MVLTLIGGVLALVLTVYTVMQLAVLAHWLSVAGAVIVSLGSVYYILKEDLLGFLGLSSETVELAVASILAATAGVVSYGLFEAVFAAAGGLIGLLIVGFAVLGTVLGFGTLLGGIISFLEVIFGE